MENGSCAPHGAGPQGADGAPAAQQPDGAPGARQPAGAPCAQPYGGPGPTPGPQPYAGAPGAQPYGAPSAQQAPPAPGYGAQQPGAPQGPGPYAPQPQRVGAPQGNGPYAPAAQPGALSTAWADVRASKGWFGKAALLAVVMLVPVLNFFAYGYLLMWGCDAALGRRGPLPRDMFREGAFVRGFFMAAMFAIVGLAVGLVAVIPFIGLLVFAGAVFLYPFVYAALMRMGLTGRFGSLFEFSEIGRAFKAGMGQAVVSWLVPILVESAIIGVVSIPLGIAAVMPLIMAVGGDGVTSAYLTSVAPVAIACMLGGMMLLAYAASLAGTCALMVSLRAFGRWTARYAPHWAAPRPAGFGETA